MFIFKTVHRNFSQRKTISHHFWNWSLTESQETQSIVTENLKKKKNAQHSIYYYSSPLTSWLVFITFDNRREAFFFTVELSYIILDLHSCL